MAIAVALLALGAKYYIAQVESEAFDRGRAELQAEFDASSLKLALAYAERIKTAQEERNESQIIADKLSTKLARMRKLHIPVCPTVAAGENQSGATELFSRKVDATFARFRLGATELIERCHALNLDAIAANARQ